jgi:MerR family transcriptional regulator, thiopeptide resistance regulator
MTSQFFTVSELAKSRGLSRSTLLYYDRLGLLTPRRKNGSNYRLYSEEDAERLENICQHRRLGIPLEEIKQLLDGAAENETAEILQRRLNILSREITDLQRQQRDIVRILNQGQLIKEAGVVNKQRWVEIMKAAGFNEQDMHKWHAQFEKMEPAAHQEFLESLEIPADEIALIRERSRTAWKA